MKKIISVIMTICMLSSLAACGAKSDEQVVTNESYTAQSSSAQSEASISETVSKSKKEKDYQAILDKDVRQFSLEGVVYVSQNGEMLCKYAGGDAITIDSLFCIASLSKQFAATSVMMLQEQEKLNVDDTLNKYFPEYAIGKDITIDNMLTMQSGIVDYFAIENDEDEREYIEDDLREFSVYAEADAYDNKAELTEWLFNQPLSFEPGTSYQYSNSNYFLLAQIVEQTSGMTYHEFVRRNIFDPLEMSHSGFIDDSPTPYGLAKSFAEDDISTYPGIAEGAGDIVSCAKDMDKWLTALREATLISKDSLDKMTEHHYDAGGGMAYGYGVMLDSSGGIFHYGDILSYASAAYTNTETGLNIFAVSNNSETLFGSMSEFEQKLRSDIS